MGINDARTLNSKIFFTYMFSEKRIMPKQNKIEAEWDKYTQIFGKEEYLSDKINPNKAMQCIC